MYKSKKIIVLLPTSEIKMKSVFLRIYFLVRFPQKTWGEIVGEGADIGKVRDGFFFPCLLVVGLVGALDAVLDFQWMEMVFFAEFLRFLAIRLLVLFTSLFAGVYATVLLLPLLQRVPRLTKADLSDLYNRFALVVYASSVMWVLQLWHGLMPVLFFLPVLKIYVAYIIWCGLPILFPSIEENRIGWLAAIIFAMVLLCPLAVEAFMNSLMR